MSREIKFAPLRSAQARLKRVAELASGDSDLLDDARDCLAFSIQELAEAYGLSERGVEAIRAILVESEGDGLELDYAAAHGTPAIRVEA